MNTFFDYAQNAFERLKSFKPKGKNTLFIIGIAGILLIFISNLFSGGGAQNTGKNNGAVISTQTQNSEYIANLEKKLADLLCNVEGVGQVKVMITLEYGSENIYALKEDIKQGEAQSANGQYSTDYNYSGEYIFVQAQDGSKQALVKTSAEPVIKGVAVLSKGAADIKVVKQITDIVSVVLGVPTHRVCVTKMI